MACVEVPLGSQFGSWTTIGPREGLLVPVRCVCGYVGLVSVTKLRCGRSRCCRFCGQASRMSHGEAGARTRLYKIWDNMRGRCKYPSYQRYPRYGGRGISVCDEWQQFIPFRDWARSNGYTDELTIERENVDGNYEPANCKWITKSENSRRGRQKRSA